MDNRFMENDVLSVSRTIYIIIATFPYFSYKLQLLLSVSKPLRVSDSFIQIWRNYIQDRRTQTGRISDD